MLAAYEAEKTELTARREETLRRLEETTQLYRLLQLPLIASEAAPILRELDRRSLLGTQLLVIGTNAIPAYALEAAGFLADTPDETQDFDLAWTATATPEGATPVWSALKAVDRTYTVNSERTWQALNASGYAVDLLAAPSRAGHMMARDRPRPIEAETQEWLLNGRPVDHVLVARDGSPARLVVPDPRWFALHKLWLCAQETRNPLKRDKDSRQGTYCRNAVEEKMPQYIWTRRFRRRCRRNLPPPSAPGDRHGRPSAPYPPGKILHRSIGAADNLSRACRAGEVDGAKHRG